MEETTKCRLQELTLDGGRSSSMKTHTSATSNRLTSVSMFMQAKTKKEEMSSFGTDTTVLTKDGRLSILMNLQRSKIKEFTKISDGTLTDHSTWSQECQ
jgi:hypothetical protein